ncbi:MAG: hypothetical protein GOVbin4342_63 [Prokaryotic dsDNA virus sp.]|nr:MAG: hypothetical protein GOVbin4342_63 [Prokaryotic dsDNA virus sp.]|tara:strand:- start:2106 stop:3254 length:1149 start_codon:yes stop_codon:yes gene_type:complete
MGRKSKLEPFKAEILELRKKGMTYPQISKHLKKEHGLDISRRGVCDFVIGNNEGDAFETELSDNKFSLPDNWSHGWLKGKHASIFIKNTKGLITFDEMRAKFVAEMKQYSPSYRTIKRKQIKDKHLLVLDIADLHMGKYASESETGDAYDSDKAIERALEGVEGILNKAKGFPIDKIMFIIGNDVLHIDNPRNTTTSGTGQDVSGMWHENYVRARDLYVKIIERLMTIADVHIVHNPSNHDYISGFMLADSIFCWFRKSKNITFDISNNHRKYFTYGVNLIGSSHGDGAKMADMPLLMANEAPLLWAETKYRYIYLHHIHHKQQTKFMSGKDYQGVTVEYLRSPSGSDAWHHRNGYVGAKKAIEAFIHSKDYGQIARLTHLF